MRKIIFPLFLLLILISADVFADNFNDYLSYANSQKDKAAEATDKFPPNATLPKYTDNPSQTRYFGGVAQGGDNGLASDAAANVDQDKSGSMVDNAFKTRPVFKINPDSPEMKKGSFIEGDSYDISRGISDKYVNCQKAHNCTTKYITKTCDEQTRVLEKTCVKTAEVEVQTTNDVITGNIIPDGQLSGSLTVPEDGLVTAFKITANVNGVLWNNTPTGTLQGLALVYQGGGSNPTFNLSYGEGKAPIEVKKGDKLEFTVSGYYGRGFFWRKRASLRGANYSITIQNKIPKTTWKEVCNGTGNSFSNCSPAKTECTQEGGTRYFDSVPVTLPCWQYTASQTCNNAAADNNCDALRSQGCTELSAKCRTMIGNICVVQDETYNCPVKHCSTSDGIICGGKFFCMNGDCSSHVPEQSQDFDKAVSEMAAVGSSGEDVQKNNGVSAFSGDSMDCRKIGFGNFNNCCKNNGWGQDIGLAHCNDEEKQLGHDKEDGRTVDVGFKCDKHYPKPFHGCMKGHEVYCVFSSKMAYLIQTQGRWSQLHIGFGSADEPNCRGITPDELSEIDFSKIDFSSLYKDMENNTKFPNTNKTENDIANRVKDFYDHNQNHN